MDGNLGTVGKPRLLARVNLGRAEVDHHQNPTRVQVVVAETQFLRLNQSSSFLNMPTLLLQEQQEY